MPCRWARGVVVDLFERETSLDGAAPVLFQYTRGEADQLAVDSSDGRQLPGHFQVHWECSSATAFDTRHNPRQIHFKFEHYIPAYMVAGYGDGAMTLFNFV